MGLDGRKQLSKYYFSKSHAEGTISLCRFSSVSLYIVEVRHAGSCRPACERRAKVPRGFEVGDKGEHNFYPAELGLITGLYNDS